MIVATRTRQRHSKKSSARHINLIIDNVRQHFLFVRVPSSPLANRHQPRRNRAICVEPAIRPRQQIARELLPDEFVVR